MLSAIIFLKISFSFFNRIKKLDKFQFIIIEELENFEKDSQYLKDLEKEFVVCAYKSLKIIVKPHFFFFFKELHSGKLLLTFYF